jgi:hypothetical protein
VHPQPLHARTKPMPAIQDPAVTDSHPRIAPTTSVSFSPVKP